MKLDRIRTGLLGYGLSGSVFHAPLLSVLEEFDIKKVMTSRKEQVNSEIPEAEAVSSIEDITGDPNIDLVIVTMPSGLHFEAAKECLLAGKHVVLEKPMTATAEEAEELIHLATEKGVLLSVYHNRRWDNDFLTIKQLISEGRLGDINTFHASYDRYRPNVRQRWREQKGPGSGALYDLGSHLIDQVLHLFGMPEAVTAQVAAQRDGAETDDYFHIVLHYGKLQAILHSGSIVPANGPRYQVHGQKEALSNTALTARKMRSERGKNQAANRGEPIFRSTTGVDRCRRGRGQNRNRENAARFLCNVLPRARCKYPQRRQTARHSRGRPCRHPDYRSGQGKQRIEKDRFAQ